MKFTKQLRFAALSVVCVSVLASCIKDPVGPYEAELASTRLAISLPGLQNGMKTRAGDPGDFDAINNLNIFITSGNKILHSLYIPSLAGDWAGEEDDEGITGTPDDNNYEYVVTYPGVWLDTQDGVHRRGADNYIVVANYGEPIEVANVTALREIEIQGINGGVSPAENVMFGESGVEVTVSADKTSGNKSVELKRIAAIITLKINANLSSGVEITPLKVSLHNVPAASFIGKPNSVTAQIGGTVPSRTVISEGESYSTSSWPVIAGETEVGGHYGLQEIKYKEEVIKVPDFSTGNENVVPLFMFENYHGENFGADENEQAYKRPAGIARDQEAIEENSAACSYLQVEAYYRSGTGEGSKFGSVSYRVFLGADALQDFNVMRNNYYLVTLNLRDTGIGEDGYSWRLDTNLGTIELVESDFILNGSGEEILLEALGDESSSNFTIFYDGPGGDWLSFYNEGWNPMSYLNGSGSGKMTLPGVTALYVQPMIRDVTWFGDEHVRRVTFRLEQKNTKVTIPWITVTQYEPIAIPLSRYIGDADIEALVGELGWDMNGTVYLDRIDSEPLPWGFDETQIAEGDVTEWGFNNGENLMWNYEGAADNYTPYGYADGGSAVMRAAFIKYYQRNTLPPPAALSPNPTFNAIRAFGDVPAGYPSFFLPSVEQAELLNMLNKARPIEFEEGLVMPPFQDYWTSSAVPGGDQAHIFRISTPVSDGVIGTADRSTPIAYRMMAYMPPAN